MLFKMSTDISCKFKILKEKKRYSKKYYHKYLLQGRKHPKNNLNNWHQKKLYIMHT